MKPEKLNIYYDLNLTPREQQITGIKFLQDSIRSGKKYMLLNLPTGVGKSYLSVMFINWYLNFINSEAKFDILTNSKLLQKQYINEFPYIRNLEGRANYKCYTYNTNCEEGMELCNLKKHKCDDCPYLRALNNYINSRVSMTNFHMFDIANIYATGLKTSRKSNVLIVDEAHDFESVFCDYLTTELSINSFIKCGFDNNELTVFRNMISKINDLDDFIVDMKDEFLTSLKKQYNYLKNIIEKTDEFTIKTTKDSMIKYTRQLRECESKINSIEIFLKEYASNESNWILEVNHRIDKRSKEELRVLTIQPVWANDYIPKYIMESYDHVIFMSATILNNKLFSQINGLEENLTTYHEIPSPFPVKNRMIYYIKTGKMTYKEKTDTYQRQVEYLKKIFDKYSDKKGIIHTFNYEIATWLQRDFKNTKYSDRLIFHETSDRNEKFEKHLNSDEPTILISPSMMSGVDLKDDLSRFQIILKMPYPNIQSKKIKRRQETHKDWYSWKTIVDLIQSYGRSVRSENDHADTFILDSSLTDIMNYNGKFLPRYFTNAIKILKI
jgi:Rad3-related DNA helicase